MCPENFLELPKSVTNVPDKFSKFTIQPKKKCNNFKCSLEIFFESYLRLFNFTQSSKKIYKVFWNLPGFF